MAKSTGIMLAATAISFGNEWLNTGEPNIRLAGAGLAATLFLDGVEMLNSRAAVGIASIALVTVLVTPFNGKSPAQTVYENFKPKGK